MLPTPFPPPLQLLAPLFFASIGLSIPFLDLWTGTIIWRGVVYSVLMTLGKVLVGGLILAIDAFHKDSLDPSATRQKSRKSEALPSRSLSTCAVPRHRNAASSTSALNKGSRLRRGTRILEESLPAASFLGFALVARGEIGVSRQFWAGRGPAASEAPRYVPARAN
jgi:hypothetical protein